MYIFLPLFFDVVPYIYFPFYIFLDLVQYIFVLHLFLFTHFLYRKYQSLGDRFSSGIVTKKIYFKKKEKMMGHWGICCSPLPSFLFLMSIPVLLTLSISFFLSHPHSFVEYLFIYFQIMFNFFFNFASSCHSCHLACHCCIVNLFIICNNCNTVRSNRPITFLLSFLWNKAPLLSLLALMH